MRPATLTKASIISAEDIQSILNGDKSLEQVVTTQPTVSRTQALRNLGKMVKAVSKIHFFDDRSRDDLIDHLHRSCEIIADQARPTIAHRGEKRWWQFDFGLRLFWKTTDPERRDKYPYY